MSASSLVAGLVAVARQAAETNFARHGFLTPVALFIKPDQGAMIARLPEGKVESAQAVRDTATQLQAIAVAVSLEVWTADLRDDEMADAARNGLADHPRRQEAIWILVEAPGEHVEQQAMISRDASGRGALGPWVLMPPSIGRYGGYFTTVN